mmetsp:Transcript_1303/g.4849  ORF Transcript_1303/g.4849 Transcript_1303/m.4849 type:complete len:406 (+) Transcript_1303:30-1247(+)
MPRRKQYRQIGKVRFDESTLALADEFQQRGEIDEDAARELFGHAEERSVTETEWRTLRFVMKGGNAKFTYTLTAAAADYLRHVIAEGAAKIAEGVAAVSELTSQRTGGAAEESGPGNEAEVTGPEPEPEPEPEVQGRVGAGAEGAETTGYASADGRGSRLTLLLVFTSFAAVLLAYGWRAGLGPAAGSPDVDDLGAAAAVGLPPKPRLPNLAELPEDDEQFFRPDLPTVLWHSKLHADAPGALFGNCSRVRGLVGLFARSAVHPCADEWVLEERAQHTAELGDCLALEAEGAAVEVQLRTPSRPTALTLAASPEGAPRVSAPKQLRVHGIRAAAGARRDYVYGASALAAAAPADVALLGTVTYDGRGQAHDTKLEKPPFPIDVVHIQAAANHGSDKTCLYDIAIR